MEMLKLSFRLIHILLLFLFFTTLTFAQQVTDAQFEKAESEYNRLSSELNRIHNEMSKASESKDLDKYNELKKQYDKIAADRKIHEQVRIDHLKQNKELVNVKKIFNEGQQAFKIGNMQVAMAKYNESITKGKEAKSPALNDVISKAYYQIGLIHKKDKRFQDAIDVFNNAIKFAPSSEECYYALGNTYSDMGQDNLAITNYEKAIKINPSFYQAYYNMGTVYIEQANRLDKENSSKIIELLKNAESAFRDAIRIEPTYYQSVASLGRVLVETRRQTEGILMLSKAVELKSNYWMPYYYLAIAYNQIKDPRSAIENANLCLKYRRNYGGAYIEIGDAYAQMGNDNKAIEEYSKALNDRSYRKLAEYKIDVVKNKDKYLQ